MTTVILSCGVTAHKLEMGSVHYCHELEPEDMCHFNRVMRPSIHRWQNLRDGGLDGCYDCTAECRLLRKYAQIWGQTGICSHSIIREVGRGLT
jgi:hypothetical protein